MSTEEERRIDLDERKRKRMLSNRESARRSRARKQKHLNDLINEICKLQEENSQISDQVKLRNVYYARVEAENRVMRVQVTELTERLRSISSLLRLLMEIPDPLLKPWQLSCPAQANVFQC